MHHKEVILKVMGHEIDKWSSFYEGQIADLQKEIVSLNSKVEKLKSKNEVLQSKINLHTPADHYKNKYESLLRYMQQLSGGVTYDLLEEWCLSSDIEDAYMLLIMCEKLISNNDYKMSLYILELLNHNQNPLLHHNEKIQELYQSIMSLLFLNDSEVDEEFDKLVISGLELLMKLGNSSLRSVNATYIQKNFYKILDNIFNLNTPSILTRFMRVCLIYNLRLELIDTFHQMLDVEWGFLDSSIAEDDFIFLLWYSYLFDFDELLLENASASIQWFQESNRDLSLYFYLYNSTNKTIIPNKEGYQFQQKNLQDGSVLTNLEKSKIFAKVESELNPLMIHQKKEAIFDYKISSIKDEQVDDFIQLYDLDWKSVSIPLFQDKNDNRIRGYINETLLLSKTGKKAFIPEEKLERVNKKHFPLIIKTKNTDGIIINKDPSINDENKHQSIFSWPETELKSITSVTEVEEKNLNENSALKLMGSNYWINEGKKVGDTTKSCSCAWSKKSRCNYSL
ncbi:hypothetical protein [Cytobacillus gottheilii]|uniref:hypothetical protein n=1 Tax=Cytobacillus gottheilii TaxID=859144 RepID=UPI002494194A|nr:hypothetical protein [Cytobacillus gottheilii]